MTPAGVCAMLRLAGALPPLRSYLAANDATGRGFSFTLFYHAGIISVKSGKQMPLGAEQRAFDVVIVHKLDRFSRNLVDTSDALTRLADNNVSFVSVTESQFDFTTPQDKLSLVMVALILQWYVDNLSQETSKVKRERAMQGGWNGAFPSGYITPKKLRERANAGELDVEAVTEYLESISFELETDAIIDPHNIKGYLMPVDL